MSLLWVVFNSTGCYSSSYLKKILDQLKNCHIFTYGKMSNK